MIYSRFFFLLFSCQFFLLSGKTDNAFDIAEWNDLSDRVAYHQVDGVQPVVAEAFDSAAYEQLNGQTINLGFYSGGVWIKFDLNPNEGELLVLGNPILDRGILYKQQYDSLIQFEEIGDLSKFSERTVKHRKPVFSIPKLKEKTTFYLFVSNQGEQFYLPILLWSKKDLNQFDLVESYFFGGYLGVLLFVLIFNVFIAVGLKERNIFNYIFYLIGLILLQLALSGYGIKWFYSDYPNFAARSTTLFSSFSILFLLAFAKSFLAIKSHLPKKHKILSVAQILLVFNILLSLVLPINYLKGPILFINVVTFVFGLWIIPVAYKIYKAGYQPARYFLLAFISLIACVFAFVLRNLGLIENNFLSENGLIVGSSLEVILITFAIIDKFKTFRDQSISRLEEINKIKSDANLLLETKVKERTHELEFQKNLVEDKNEEITDSINYAKRIQNAILPPLDSVKLGAKDAFVLFRPKDIVSGDFYWVTHIDNRSFYVVADCTGHGVPGAFMSMIGNALLNQIVKEKRIFTPGEILNQLRLGVIDALSQNQSDITQKDGMDLALIFVNQTNKTIQFSGANNGLYLIRRLESETQCEEAFVAREEFNDKGLYELKPNKMPIGVFGDELSPFTTHQFKFADGDSIYLFSDGFADQFGGERGKKLKYKNFRKALLEVSGDSGDQQSVKLDQFYTDWMDASPIDNFQIDDVCVMGLKL